MNTDALKKLGIVALILYLALPVLPTVIRKLTPVPLTFDRVKAAFEASQLTVEGYTVSEVGVLDSTASVMLYVNGAAVGLYRYSGDGPSVKQMEYHKPDSGSMAVGAMGIAQSLGARVQRVVPTTVTRNGLTMLVVRSEDKALNSRIASLFESL